MSRPIIEVKDLTFRYDLREENDTLSPLSFTIHEGEWIAVIGKNGAGKSTLAKLLVGLLQPQSGKIHIDGLELNDSTKWEIRKKIGIVFQNPDNQFIGTTVQDDVAFSLENENIPYREMKERVDWALKLVGMEEFREVDPSRLSGGQKQRVSIAGVLAKKAPILILDEAFVMLDPKSRNELLAFIQQLKRKEGLTVLSITHDMNEAAFSDRILYLKNGKLANSGTPEEIFGLEDLPFHPPFSEQLRRLLKELGRKVPEQYMSEEEMVDWICK